MAITTLTEHAHSSTTTTTLTLPASILDGDLIVIVDRFVNSSGLPSDTAISDYTRIHTVTGGSTVRISLYYKIAVAADSSANVTVPTGTTGLRATGVVLRPDEAITGVTQGGEVGEISNNNPASQNITSGSGVAPLVAIAAWANGGSDSAISPRTQSPAMTEISDNTHQYLGYKFYASSPADQSFDMDDEGGGNALIGAYLQLTGYAGPTINGQFFSVF